MTGHPLDPNPADREPLAPETGTPKLRDAGFWEDHAPNDGPMPERPLLKPFVILLIAGGVVAFLAGVAASNSSPNSTGENVGSWLNRAGVLLMLVACCGIMFAYRYTYLRDMLTRASGQTWRGSEMLNIVLLNAGVILVSGGILFAFSLLRGNWVLLPAASIFCVHLSMSVTIIFFHSGAWRGYGIGVATAILFVFIGGMTNILWGFLGPQVWMGSSRMRNELPIWPILALHLFVVLNGIVCAGYVSMLSFVNNARKEREPSEADSNQLPDAERAD